MTKDVVQHQGLEARERAAFLFRAYGATIYSRCRRILKDDALAEDALQEVFVRVYQHVERARDAETALVWINRISRNYCLNLIRDRARRAEPMAPSDLPEGEAESCEPVLMNRQAARCLVTRAPRKLQAVAALCYLDGLEEEQIARTLGISRRTVVNRLRHFHERSRKFIAREGLA
ncbi:MAG: RNA polymerase sigma factor [Myxococcota bacterium]